MPANMHNMTFTELYREREQGAQRARMNESCIDPDLIHFTEAEVTKVIDRWKMDGVEESMMLNMTHDLDKWKNY